MILNLSEKLLKQGHTSPVSNEPYFIYICQWQFLG